jgi:hypothetical protein
VAKESAVRRQNESSDDWTAAEKLLADWTRRARESQFCHYEAALYFGYLNYAIGIPVVILTCLVGTTVYATLQKSVSVPVQLTVGAISVLAAVLAGLQTFLRFGERAEKHRTLGAQYGSVRRRVEMIKALSPERRGAINDFLNDVRETLDALAESAPDVPPRVWGRAAKKLRRNEVDSSSPDQRS